jgi:hypothetical protein
MKFGDPRLLDTVRSIQWDDMSNVSKVATEVLEELAASPEWIADALENLVEDEHLRSLTERLAELDKLVLIDDVDSNVRIRMHVFRKGYFDRPHNHRFNFGSRILSGAYIHSVYGDYPDVDADIDPASLKPKLVKREAAGAAYCIEHTIVHSVSAEPDTVTLTVRGPAQKDRMLIIDQKQGQCWWVFGAKDESKEEILARRLDTERLRSIQALVAEQGLI